MGPSVEEMKLVDAIVYELLKDLDKRQRQLFIKTWYRPKLKIHLVNLLTNVILAESRKEMETC